MPLYRCEVKLKADTTLRIDRYAADILRLLSRSQLAVRGAAVEVNGRPCKLSRQVKNGDSILIRWDDQVPHHLVPEQIPLGILYEDRRVIVVNKRQGMVVHPGAGNWSGTLANALLGYRLTKEPLTAVLPASGDMRPFIVHRLDKDTSGVIIAAWDMETLTFLQDQFRARTVRKTYVALCRGTPPENSGLIAAPLARDPKNRKLFAVSAHGGRRAYTRYRNAGTFTRVDAVYTLLVLQPKTGRTHQLRVHLKHLGCPILGDPLYGSVDRNFPQASLALHARRLALHLPGSASPTVFKAPLPDHLRSLIAAMGLRPPTQ